MMRVIRLAGSLALAAGLSGGWLAGSALAQRPAPIMLAPSVKSPPEQEKDIPAQSYAIEVLFKQQRIWADTLRVAARGSASFSQQKSQSGLVCAGMPGDPRRSGNLSESVRVDLNWFSPPEKNLVTLTVRLERPKPVCGAVGSDTISINRGISLEQGKTVVIEGEGGLTVRVTRQ